MVGYSQTKYIQILDYGVDVSSHIGLQKKEEEKVTPVSFTCFISEKRERSLCIPSSNQLFYKYNNNEYSTNKWQNQNYKHTTLRQAQCPIS